MVMSPRSRDSSAESPPSSPIGSSDDDVSNIASSPANNLLPPSSVVVATSGAVRGALRKAPWHATPSGLRAVAFIQENYAIVFERAGELYTLPAHACPL